jgi:hypothetical protein
VLVAVLVLVYQDHYHQVDEDQSLVLLGLMELEEQRILCHLVPQVDEPTYLKD